VTFTTPATPGTYQVRFFLNDSTAKLATSATITVAALATVTASATTVPPGATVTATISNGPGTGGDWVGLFATNDPDATYQDWKYLNGSRTRPATGVTAATVTLTAPTTPGTYELRFFLNDSLTRLATSSTITVTVSAAPSSGVIATNVQQQRTHVIAGTLVPSMSPLFISSTHRLAPINPLGIAAISD